MNDNESMSESIRGSAAAERGAIQSSSHPQWRGCRSSILWEIRQTLPEFRKKTVVCQCDEFRLMPLNLFNQEWQVASSCEGHHAKLFWEFLGDLESLGSD